MFAALLKSLAEFFDSPLAIDRTAKAVLLQAAQNPVPELGPVTELDCEATPLHREFIEVMKAEDAHPVCASILALPFDWKPPQTSDDPAYQALGHIKAHVELIGPDGLIPSQEVRIGLYGILPHSEYGIRTHPAEETFKMLAGEVYWRRGESPYSLHLPGSESYHPSMLPHATKTGEKAFMSIYVWHGDVSKDGYVFSGQKG